MDPLGFSTVDDSKPSPRASLFMRLLAGEYVPPDTRSFETKYLHLKGVLPVILLGTAFFAGLLGYLIGTL